MQYGGLNYAPNPDGSPQSFGEACLVLNIYTPRNATAAAMLPVLVFGACVLRVLLRSGLSVCQRSCALRTVRCVQSCADMLPPSRIPGCTS